MLKKKSWNGFAIVGFGLALAALPGCQTAQPKQDNVYHGEQFRPDDEPRATQTLLDTQEAAGDRTDATLYPSNFDAGSLNSLGKAKLDAMLRDSRSANPMVIYMAIADDTFSEDRRLAVGNYLMDRGGLKTEQIKFADGPNPDTYAPVAPNLKNYDRTDTSAAGGSSSDGSSSPGGAQ